MLTVVLELHLLRSLILTADSGTFARAAEHLGVTQAAVSLQISRLERLAGKKLLRRDGRRQILTDAGDLLLRHARRMLTLNDETVAGLQGIDVSGLVRLGIAHDFAETWLPEVIARFTQRHPAAQIEVFADRRARLEELFARNQIDLCLGWTESAKPSFARSPISWIGAHGVDWSHSTPLPLILFESPCLFRQVAVEALDRAKLPWKIVFTSASLAGIWAAARAGIGVAVRTPQGLPPGLDLLKSSRHLPKLGNVGLQLRAREELSAAARELKAVLLETVKERLAPRGKHKTTRALPR